MAVMDSSDCALVKLAMLCVLVWTSGPVFVHNAQVGGDVT